MHVCTLIWAIFFKLPMRSSCSCDQLQICRFLNSGQLNLKILPTNHYSIWVWMCYKDSSYRETFLSTSQNNNYGSYKLVKPVVFFHTLPQRFTINAYYKTKKLAIILFKATALSATSFFVILLFIILTGWVLLDIENFIND